MSKIGLRAKDSKTIDRVQEIIANTVILKRQFELEYGKWDFVVVGPKDKKSTVIREGFAKHLTIHQSSIYIANIGLSGSGECYGSTGIPLEEFTDEDIPEEFNGLEIINAEPIRPLSVTKKKDGPILKDALYDVQKEYDNKNVALIQTPDEAYWGISILKYLNECDEYFPDALVDAIRKGRLPVNCKFDIDWSSAGCYGTKDRLKKLLN